MGAISAISVRDGERWKKSVRAANVERSV